MLDDDDEDVEMVTRGDYYQKNGKHYIMYDEQMEGFEGTVKNIIKKGITSAHMQFEKNKKNLSCYNTPLGDLVIGIQANRIRIDEEEDCLKINVEYSLDINYQHASDCNIMLDIQSVHKPTADTCFA